MRRPRFPDTCVTCPCSVFGLIVYDLQPGCMIKSAEDMAGPTTISAGTWSCRSDQERQPGQGAGSLVMAYFKQNNG